MLKKKILASWLTLIRLPVRWVDTECQSLTPLTRLADQDSRRPASCASTNARPWWIDICSLVLICRGHKSSGRRQGCLPRQSGLERLILLM